MKSNIINWLVSALGFVCLAMSRPAVHSEVGGVVSLRGQVVHIVKRAKISLHPVSAVTVTISGTCQLQTSSADTVVSGRIQLVGTSGAHGESGLNGAAARAKERFSAAAVLVAPLPFACENERTCQDEVELRCDLESQNTTATLAIAWNIGAVIAHDSGCIGDGGNRVSVVEL